MYTFKFEALLKHRIFLEDRLKKEFASIQRELAMEKNILEGKKSKQESTILELDHRKKDGMNAKEITMFQRFISCLSSEIKQQDKIVMDLDAKLEEKRDMLIEAGKNRKILEKLKERGIKAYKTRLLKEEFNFVNEIAVNRYHRKNLFKDGDQK